VPTTRYAELGAFLRSRRDRVQPSDVGLSPGPRRRVPGLRRDEVALVAGASVEYYIELERGAGSQPSDLMLAALARALRLDKDERDHLYRLANRPIPPQGGQASHVHPGMLDLLTRLEATPAMVITDLYRWFTDTATRDIYPDEDHAAQSRSYVADLRAAIGRRDPSDADATQLLGDLLRLSPEFSELWADHDVAVRRDERKRILHPTVGLLDLNCLNLFSEDGRQRLLWFAPRPATDTADRLALLTVVGTESLTPDAGRPVG
jgi:transcriptional regulator with XRE-family HTH domain